MAHSFCIFDLYCYISSQGIIFRQFENESILTSLKLISILFRVVDELLTTFSHYLDIGLLELEFALKLYAINANYFGVKVRVLQKLLKVFYVLYLAGLRDAVAFHSKSPLSVKFHYFSSLSKNSKEKEKAANNSACPTFSVIAMENCDSFDIPAQKSGNLVANGEQNIKRWSFVVFPVVATYITQFSLFNWSAADVDGDVFVLMCILEQLSD